MREIGVSRFSDFCQRQKELFQADCLIFRSDYVEVRGLRTDGGLDHPITRSGFKHDPFLGACYDVRGAVGMYSSVAVIGKERNGRGEWIVTDVVNVRGKK